MYKLIFLMRESLTMKLTVKWGAIGIAFSAPHGLPPLLVLVVGEEIRVSNAKL